MTEESENQVVAWRYSVGQAARALGCSAGSIRRWADMGLLESVRTPGGQRRFSAKALADFAKHPGGAA